MRRKTCAVTCTSYFSLIIVKSLQLRRRRQIVEPHKYCLVRVIVSFGMYFLYFFFPHRLGIRVISLQLEFYLTCLGALIIPVWWVNGLFGWHEFGFGFGFEGAQIQILYLGKLKKMDSDLAQIHLGFQGSKSMDLNSSHKPKNLEIPHPHASSLFSILHKL